MRNSELNIKITNLEIQLSCKLNKQSENLKKKKKKTTNIGYYKKKS